MKKFLAVLISFFSLVFVLASCKSTNPSCVLELTSTDTTVSYSLSFTDLDKNQTSYKIEILKGETSVKAEESSTSITAGSFTGLDLNTNYTVNVYVTAKETYDSLLASEEISTKKGTLKGVEFASLSFVYDGKAKSLEVSNLPQGATVSYTGNGMTEVGKYTVTAVVKKDSYEDLTLTAELTITAKAEDFTLNDKKVVYNGKAQSLVSNTDLELTYEYYLGDVLLENNQKPVDAGVYTVKAIYAGDKNHSKVEKTATLTIEKATYDMSGVHFEDASFTYDGAEHELVISGTLPTGVSVSYENNKLTNAGNVTAKAIFSGDTKNYNAIEAQEAVLTIAKADVTITASDATLTLGEEIQIDYECSLPNAVCSIKLYDQEHNEVTEVTKTGNYVAIISFAGDENHNPCDEQVSVVVTNPANQNVTITLANIDIIYGQSYVVAPTADHDVAAEDLVIRYYKGSTLLSSMPTNAGEYRIVVSFAGDEENFLNPASKSVDLIIRKATIDMSGVTFEDLTVTFDNAEHAITISGELPEGVSVTYVTNKRTNAGSVAAKARFTYIDTTNYNAIPEMTATLTIEQAEPSLDGVQKSFNNPYAPGMTLEAFRAKLEAANYSASDYTISLSSGDNKVTVTYDLGDSNYKTVEVEVTLTCIAQLTGYEVEDGSRQIKGREFDITNIVVTLFYNDGTSKLADDKDYSVVEETINTSSNFTITIKLNKGNEGDYENKSLEIHPIDAPSVMIYAVYGAGGNSGATYTNDFVILYNATAEDIDLTGWSIQQAAGNTSTNNNVSNVAVLSETIPAYGFYAILCAGGNNGVALPFAADAACTASNINLAASNFQLFLSTTSKKLTPSIYANGNYVDMVGAGTATNKEGSAVAPAPDKASYIKRKDIVDTNDNGTDFEKIEFSNSSVEFNYLAEGHTAYNYAKTVLDSQNLDFNNLPDSFELPVNYKGTSIQWTMPDDVAACLSIAADGTVTVSKASNCNGKIVGTIAGYPYGFEYDVYISNKTRLNAPTVALNHFTLSWETVTNAVSYDIYVDGTLYANTTSLAYDLYAGDSFATTFANVKNYNITVVAKCEANSADYEDSAESVAVVLKFADTSNLNNLVANQTYTLKVVVTVKGAGSQNNFYVRDVNSNQGLLVYNYSGEDGDAFFSSIEPGNVVYITGRYSLYNNSPQLQSIVGVTVTEETASTNAITETCALTAADLARPISLSDAIVVSKFANNLLKVAVGENQFNLYLSAAYVADVTTIQDLLPGNTVTFTGAVGKYNDTIQIYLTGYTVTGTDVSADYKLDVSLEEAEANLNAAYTSGTVVSNLLVAGTTYTDVAISYIVTDGSDKASVSSDNTTLTFGTVEEATPIKLQITATLGATSKNTEKSITLNKSGVTTDTITLASTNTGNAVNMTAGVSPNNNAHVGDTEGLFDIASAKNSASNEVGVNKDGTLRLYYHSSQNGTTLTITGKTVTITKVKITYKSSVPAGCSVKINDGDVINLTSSYSTNE
ncbi:MAG: lamin tail domain-containing protein, partial [Anaeroplasmataceae bacterium]|nr:lamin tail domain-containing protein [Anaeroplasmataceae bacterium]